MKEYFGEDKVLNVATFSKISPKTAIERACRGLGVSNDTAAYLKSLIPVGRNGVDNLTQALYGDKNKDVSPVSGLKGEMNKYPNLITCALGIEGLITNRGTHAAGVIVCNEPYTNYISSMRSADGTLTTCYDLWDTEEAGCIKFDMLTVNAADKIHKTMDWLLKDNHITWEGSLKATYYKWLHPDVLIYDNQNMWKTIPEIYSIFQFDTSISQKALSATHPTSVMDLSAANSLLRLMPDNAEETPIDKYIRYKENHNAWVEDTKNFGLNQEEQAVLWKYLADAYGMADSQEKVMRLSMDEHTAGYSLKEANALRKSIAKKDKRLQEEAKILFFKCCERQGTRKIFADYIWNVVFAASMGYSFSQLHSYSYSIIALQELNLNYFYPKVYWNVACLSTEAVSNENGSGNATDYGEIAKAIYKMKAFGIDVLPPDINEADYDFGCDYKTNRIFFALSAISGINKDIANQIISNRPYTSFEDFYNKNNFQGSLVTNSKFVQLIKAGCFDEFEPNRRKIMRQYVELFSQPKTSIEMNNFAEIKRLHVSIPKDIIAPYNFKKYVTSKQFFFGNHPTFKSKKLYRLDEKGEKYFNKNCRELLKEGVDYWYDSDCLIFVDKSLEKILSPAIEKLKEYTNTPTFIKAFNDQKIKYNYYDLVKSNNNENHWSFEAVSYFAKEHEFAKVDDERYLITPFEEMPQDPIFTEKTFNGKTWHNYELYQLLGVVIARNDNHHTLTILDYHNNVVNCKVPNQGLYAFFKQQFSEIDANGNKIIVDPSWFKRGQGLILTGYRNGENDFRLKKYSKSIFQHYFQKVNKINSDGSLDITSERYGQNTDE